MSNMSYIKNVWNTNFCEIKKLALLENFVQYDWAFYQGFHINWSNLFDNSEIWEDVNDVFKDTFEDVNDVFKDTFEDVEINKEVLQALDKVWMNNYLFICKLHVSILLDIKNDIRNKTRNIYF